MKKGLKIILALIATIVILFAGISLYLYLPYLKTAQAAVLEIEKGSVDINKGDGWQKAESETELKEGWNVRTSLDSEARVIFYGSSVARLGPDAELVVWELGLDNGSRNVYLEQITGDIWYDIIPTSDVDFRILTPDGVLKDAGTSFGCSIASAASVKGLGDTTVTAGTTVAVVKGQVVRYTGDAGLSIVDTNTQTTFSRNGELSSKPLVRTAWVEKNTKASQDWVIEVREILKKKYSSNIAAAKLYAKFIGRDLTDEMLNTYFDQALTGDINVGKMISDGTIPKQYSNLIPPELIIPDRLKFFVPKDVIPTPTPVPYVKTGSAGDTPLIYVPKDVVPTPVKTKVPSITTKSTENRKPLIFIPKDAVPNSNECSFGQTREIVWTSKISKKTTNGVEWLRVSDWGSLEGNLSTKEKKEIMENTKLATEFIKILEIAQASAVSVLEGLEGGLAVAFAHGAPEAVYIGASAGMEHVIFDQLESWHKTWAIGDYPVWIEIEYGPIWELTIWKRTIMKGVYSCQNGHWEYSHTEPMPDVYSKTCIVGPGGSVRVPTMQEGVDFSKSLHRNDIMASALGKEIPKAIDTVMRSMHVTAVGKNPCAG